MTCVPDVAGVGGQQTPREPHAAGELYRRRPVAHREGGAHAPAAHSRHSGRERVDELLVRHERREGGQHHRHKQRVGDDQLRKDNAKCPQLARRAAAVQLILLGPRRRPHDRGHEEEAGGGQLHRHDRRRVDFVRSRDEPHTVHACMKCYSDILCRTQSTKGYSSTRSSAVTD